jgi:hypothetical protein
MKVHSRLLKGLASNSASPTDTWILSTTMYNGPVFLKWFMYTEKTHVTKSLIYETNIYKKVTNPLIDHKVCPHFIKAIDGNRDEGLEGLMDILKNSGINPGDREIVLKRSLWYQQKSLPLRPSITDIDSLTPAQRTFFKSLQFPNKVRMGYTATEAIDGRSTITLEAFLLGLLKLDPSDRAGVAKYSSLLVHILFQLAFTAYAMYLSKMVHNDLHVGNVWVKKQPDAKQTYVVNDDVYSFRTPTFVMLYDFDRAYVKRLGANPLIANSPHLCEENSQCNSMVMGLDLLKVHCYMRKMLENTPFERIVDTSLKMLMKREQDLTEIVEYLNTPRCFLNKKTGHNSNTRMPPHLYELVDTAPMYINKLSALVMGLKTIPSPGDNVYICSDKMFDSNGVLHPDRRPLLSYPVVPPQQPILLSNPVLSDESLLTFSKFAMEIE